MDFVSEFLNLSTIVFCLVVFCLVWVQRKVVEGLLPKLKDPKYKYSHYWTELFVPIGPISTGGILGFLVSEYPYPEMFSTSTSRTFFGIVCGLLSGLVYRLVKKNVLEKFMNGKKESE